MSNRPARSRRYSATKVIFLARSPVTPNETKASAGCWSGAWSWVPTTMSTLAAGPGEGSVSAAKQADGRRDLVDEVRGNDDLVDAERLGELEGLLGDGGGLGRQHDDRAGRLQVRARDPLSSDVLGDAVPHAERLEGQGHVRGRLPDPGDAGLEVGLRRLRAQGDGDPVTDPSGHRERLGPAGRHHHRRPGVDLLANRGHDLLDLRDAFAGARPRDAEP